MLLIGLFLVCAGLSDPDTAFGEVGRPQAQDSLDLWGRLEPGPHGVGFRTEQLGDPRRITLYSWYPALASSTPTLRFGEYYSLYLRSRPPGVPDSLVASPERALALEATGDAAGLTAAAARRILRAPLHGVRDAKPASGPFPLVLWGSRHGTMAAQAVLAEFLASHGLVVVFAWSREDPLVYPSAGRMQPWSVGGEPALRGHEAIARITLHALRGYLVEPRPPATAELARELERIRAR